MSEVVQVLAYINAFRECRNVYERKKEEFDKYVSKDPKKSKGELAAEASKVVLDEILKRYPIETFPEIKSAMDFARSKPAKEVGEFLGEFVKFYFRQHGEEKNGEEVIKEFAYGFMKKLILKKLLGD